MQRRSFRHSTLVEGLVIAAVLVLVTVSVASRQFAPDDRRSAVESRSGEMSGNRVNPQIDSSPTTEMLRDQVDGEAISIPAADFGGMSLVFTSTPPAITQKEAMQAVYEFGVPWGLGDTHEGRRPVLSASFGLATFGSGFAEDGQWIGDRNIRLPTGEILDHIENRPMWILDYGNTIAYGSGATFNHTVYAVDTLTRGVLLVWFYNVDHEPSAETPHKHAAPPSETDTP